MCAQEDEKCGLLASLQALSEEKDRLDANLQHGLEESSSTRFQLATLTQVGLGVRVVSWQRMQTSLRMLDSPAPPLQERDRLQELVEHQTQEIEQVGGEARMCKTDPGGV